MINLSLHLQRIFKAVVALIDREARKGAPDLGTQVFSDPWVERGMADAIFRMQISADDREAVGAYAYSFAAGAKGALLLARAILSDPTVKGREQDVLSWITDGASHSDIVARIRADQNPGSNVVMLKSKS